MEGPGARILVVEDDDGNRLLVRRVLAEAGFEVVEATDGPAALNALAASRFDVVVLDLGLPGIDGRAVLDAIRTTSDVPVLLLTARAEETDRVDGLEAGADDYMIKPYSLPEFVARVRALLRRHRGQAPVESLRFGCVDIDLVACAVRVGERRVELTPKEFELLRFLALQSPKTFDRESLLHHVWGSMSGWQDVATVTEHVRRVRAKLGDAGAPPDLITTVRGFRYRVSRAESA